MSTLENNLEIIGSDEQISKVREYISTDGVYIDFNKIIEIPEELVDYSCDLLGGIVHSLLFGNSPGFDYDNYGEEYFEFGIEDDYLGNGKFDYQKIQQNKFKRLSDRKRREGFEKALKYQSNLERFEGLDNHNWLMNNWGTAFNAFSQRQISDSEIRFLTEEYSALKLIVKLSEIFPQVTFNLMVIDPEEQFNSLGGCIYDTDFYSISNGQYKYYRMNEYGEKIFINSSYYKKVDNLIKLYRENKLQSAC
jgi:hypothetical protein